jgi:hypothetical protein
VRRGTLRRRQRKFWPRQNGVGADRRARLREISSRSKDIVGYIDDKGFLPLSENLLQTAICAKSAIAAIVSLCTRSTDCSCRRRRFRGEIPRTKILRADFAPKQLCAGRRPLAKILYARLERNRHDRAERKNQCRNVGVGTDHGTGFHPSQKPHRQGFRASKLHLQVRPFGHFCSVHS